jgi:LysR family transcriptional regulator, glycine cleavage system transcriptional activator
MRAKTFPGFLKTIASPNGDKEFGSPSRQGAHKLTDVRPSIATIAAESTGNVIELRREPQSSTAKTGASSISRNFPPLGALRAFEAASRHMSFVRAAEELSVTPAAVSHQIKQLEHWIGMQLFDRGARGVTLSRTGQDYAMRVREVFDRLISTSAAARSQKTRRVVQVRAQLSIALLWVLPRITAFNQRHADIEVQLQALPFDRNPSKGGTDIAIYQRRIDVDGYTQHTMLDGSYRLYAAPALIARTGVLPPSAMPSQPLLHTVSVNADYKLPSLRDWLVLAGANPPETLPGMQFNLEHLTTAACVAGAGYALLHDELTLDAARAGSLVALPGPTIPNPNPYAITMKPIVKDEVQSVADWLMRDACA